MWPILLNKSENPNMAMGAVVVMFISSLIMFFYQMMTSPQKLGMPTKYLIMAMGIGVINGIGMILYSRLINTPNPGVYVSIIAVLMPIFGLILGYFILGQPNINLTKIIGVIFAVIGVWLITK
jgi:drug/metabolite transporter (DMT)-like permease